MKGGKYYTNTINFLVAVRRSVDDGTGWQWYVVCKRKLNKTLVPLFTASPVTLCNDFRGTSNL